MRKKVRALVLLMVALFAVTASGCSGSWSWSNSKLTVDQAEMVSYGGTYALAMTASNLAVKNDKLDPATASTIASAIETLEPYAAQLSTSNDLYTVMYPVADTHLKRFITNPKYQAMALLVTGQALRMADRYLESHPEFTKERADWMRIVSSILKGTAAGIRDGAGVPAAVPVTPENPEPAAVPRAPVR